VNPVIAIDGPAGSGKSTLAQGLSRELGLPYVNTGLMYRALTHRALAEGVPVSDGRMLAALTQRMEFRLGGVPPGSLLVDGREPSDELQSPEVEANVSTVARHPEVREVMRRLQRDLGRGGAVMEGRDIGSVVFPDATVKIFLVASLAERTARRAAERGDVEGVDEALARRDARDERVNPFVPASDAIAIDNTDKDIDEVLEEALVVIRERT